MGQEKLANQIGRRKFTGEEVRQMPTADLVAIVASETFWGFLVSQGQVEDKMPRTMFDNLRLCEAELNQRVPVRG